MNKFLSYILPCWALFDNREKALIIWILPPLVGLLFNKAVRKSLFALIKSFLAYRILTMLASMLIYTAFEIYILYEMRIWNFSLVKDTILWILFTAFVLLMGAVDIKKDKQYLKKAIFENLKLILFLEFILNFYVFRLWVEIIITPMVFMIAFIASFAKYDKGMQKIKTSGDFLFSALAIFLIGYFIYRVCMDFGGFVSINNIRAFLLPIFLTVIYLPFIYIWALIMEYDKNLFWRLDRFFIKDKELSTFTKRRIFFLCSINLWKLNELATEYTRGFMRLNDRRDVLNMIQHFKKSHEKD